MTKEITMPVADIKPFTADELAVLWRSEADDRNELWKSWKALAEQHKQAKEAIKAAHWRLLPFLKPGDEKTKAVLEQLQKFL